MIMLNSPQLYVRMNVAENVCQTVHRILLSSYAQCKTLSRSTLIDNEPDDTCSLFLSNVFWILVDVVSNLWQICNGKLAETNKTIVRRSSISSGMFPMHSSSSCDILLHLIFRHASISNQGNALY